MIEAEVGPIQIYLYQNRLVFYCCSGDVHESYTKSEAINIAKMILSMAESLPDKS